MTTRTAGRLRTVLALDRHAMANLLLAQIALIHSQLLVWTRPVGRLVSVNEVQPVPPAPAARTPPTSAADLALAVERAAENGIFRPKCLVRAVALQRMLEARAIRGGRIRLGVRWRDGRFLAHAWVELNGVILGSEVHHVPRFAPLAGIDLAPYT